MEADDASSHLILDMSHGMSHQDIRSQLTELDRQSPRLLSTLVI